MTKIINRKDQTATRQKLRRETPHAEKLLWTHLRGGVCGTKFRRQVSVGRYVVDFYSPELRLAIEVDGPTHGVDEVAVKYDSQRQAEIESHQIHFLRITNDQVYNELTDVMEMVLHTISLLKTK